MKMTLKNTKGFREDVKEGDLVTFKLCDPNTNPLPPCTGYYVGKLDADNKYHLTKDLFSVTPKGGVIFFTTLFEGKLWGESNKLDLFGYIKGYEVIRRAKTQKWEENSEGC
jgi:hypothetical protein